MANNFMTEEQKKLWIDEAIAITNNRLDSNYKNSDLYKYIMNQLNYINDCISGESSGEKLSKINIGNIAVREISPNDEVYSTALTKAYFIASYMDKGKEVPLVDEHGNIKE
ncbi:immunity protein Tsi6 family protein [Agarivorans albus]|uniref:immunity protein Tsi6 family protein n=1 Tax=Agarivorans albus TaxID=182262 RepID=UPI00058D4E61|nr:immunity protein Tsi6 family protein [Agarivorans albus]